MQRFIIIFLTLLISLSTAAPARPLEPVKSLEPMELGGVIEKLLPPARGELTWKGLFLLPGVVWSDQPTILNSEEIEATAEMRPMLNGETFHNPTVGTDFESSWTIYVYADSKGISTIALVGNGTTALRNGEPITFEAILKSNPRLAVVLDLGPRERQGKSEVGYVLKAPNSQAVQVVLSVRHMGKYQQPTIFLSYPGVTLPEDERR